MTVTIFKNTKKNKKNGAKNNNSMIIIIKRGKKKKGLTLRRGIRDVEKEGASRDGRGEERKTCLSTRGWRNAWKRPEGLETDTAANLSLFRVTLMSLIC